MRRGPSSHSTTPHLALYIEYSSATSLISKNGQILSSSLSGKNQLNFKLSDRTHLSYLRLIRTDYHFVCCEKVQLAHEELRRRYVIIMEIMVSFFFRRCCMYDLQDSTSPPLRNKGQLFFFRNSNFSTKTKHSPATQALLGDKMRFEKMIVHTF